MQEEIMLKIDNVSKKYKLGQIGGTTLIEELQRKKAKRKGLEDPTKKIGTKQINAGEEFYALNGISFEVKKGERVGIIGHNGAGKSTLLKLISRITAPTDGTLSMNGRVASMLEVGTGFHPELTGRENIYMNGAILGMTKKEIDKKIEDIIDFSECRQFIDTPVKRYSSGMYVKLAFSVAAHLDSEILIMDEVLAVGDMAFQKKCIEKMNSVSKEQGRTILYVSHNMNTIRQLCDRVIVLDHGQIIFNGDMESGIKYYNGFNLNNIISTIDLKNEKRPSQFHGQKIHINKLVFDNKEYPIYKNSELVKFTIEFNAYEDIDNLKLYFVLIDEEGNKVGMAQTKDSFIDAKSGETYKIEFYFDISNLVPDIYSFIPDIFSDDDKGNHLSYDHPMKEVFFKVTEMDSKTIKWNKKVYGNIILNNIQTKKM